jgi:hypothetical protein
MIEDVEAAREFAAQLLAAIGHVAHEPTSRSNRPV